MRFLQMNISHFRELSQTNGYAIIKGQAAAQGQAVTRNRLPQKSRLMHKGRSSGSYTMGKIEENKLSKRASLLTTAYELFVNQGFASTTISDIVRKAGLAKGTFYLYFRDKYDLRDQLVARKSSQLILEAQAAVQLQPGAQPDFETYLLSMTDYMLNYLQHNKMLLKFISKNLSWGMFRHAAEANGDPDSFAEIYADYLRILHNSSLECSQPELLLFTLIELISSTGYSCIVYESPASLETYLPYLHQAIRQIVAGFTRPLAEEGGTENGPSDQGPSVQ